MTTARRFKLSVAAATIIVVLGIVLSDTHPLVWPAAIVLALAAYEAIWWGHVRADDSEEAKG